jgi:DNA polymerase-3 subunit epsilon
LNHPLLYAVVDIETTGGFAAANGITEIALFITDGFEIQQQFHTLLNPHYTIPRYVESLTGITNQMVEDQPDFKSVAAEIFDLLHDKIFVAHNVNFDYSFIKYNLSLSGYELNCKKLCTVRLARQVIPGLKGYGLGKICAHLSIAIESRHRAGGDAAATVQLLHYLLQNDVNGHAQAMLRVSSKEQFLPPNISSREIRKLPPHPGVYYFHDKKGKVIYVGKARNLSKRVNSHFSNNKANRQKQEFLKKIYHITFQETATELMAFILESIEIKKLWPEQNRSQKRPEQSYALYSFEDARGYLRFCIDKKKKNLKALYHFHQLTEGYSLLRKLANQFELCPKLCFLQAVNIECQGLIENKCRGGCEQKESAGEYNKRVNECIHFLENELPTFALVDDSIRQNEQSCILVEKGKFYGMGCLPADVNIYQLEQLKECLTAYSGNAYINSMISQYVERYPYKKIVFKQSASLINS